MDQRLREGVKAGHTRRLIAKQLGVSRNAAIARYNRLIGVVFASDKKRMAEDLAQANERKQAERKRREGIRLALAKSYEGVRDRDRWIRSVRASGVTCAAISQTVGVSRQRVDQICSA